MADITPGWKKITYKLLAELGLAAADFAKKEIAEKASELRVPKNESKHLTDKETPPEITKITVKKV